MSASRRVLWVLALAALACAKPGLRGPSASKEAVRLLGARLDPKLPDPAAAAAVVRELGWSGREEAVEPLLSLWNTLLARKFRLQGLAPELESLRADIAEALGRLGDIKGVPALRRGLIDDDARVAAVSAAALAGLGDAASLPYLIRLAEGSDAAGACAAFEALGALGGLEAEAALRKGLSAEEPTRRAAAAYGLARMGRVGGILHLDGFLEESTELAPELILAARYLAEFGRPNGWAMLERLAREAEPGLRREAALAYGRLPGGKALGGLRALAKDADAGVREAAKRGLAFRGVHE
ncbi:MAG: HEAT repeat domain-containing protein [Elusimicrobia bacterium]|nr:HEAT repeat domain-containing protein [Elusimicrobiota bacterium]